MPWTAALTNVTKTQGVATLTLTFTDGSESFSKTYQVSAPGEDYIGRLAAQEVHNLEALDTYVAGLTLGTIVLPEQKPLSPEGQAAKDAADAATAFFADLQQLNAFKLGVEKGLIKPDDAALGSLEAAVKANYREEYTTDPRWR